MLVYPSSPSNIKKKKKKAFSNLFFALFVQNQKHSKLSFDTYMFRPSKVCQFCSSVGGLPTLFANHYVPPLP